MLKSKQNKIILGTAGILIVLVAASIWASLSFKEFGVKKYEQQALADTSATLTATQIDHIIENSNKTFEDATAEYDKSNYYIYVIAPSAGELSTANASINTFLTDGEFKSRIVDANRTIADLMADNKVVVKYYTTGQLNAMDDIATEIGRADLIYMTSSDPAKNFGGSNISQDLYEALHTYGFGSGKPIIFEYNLANTGSGDDITITPPGPTFASNTYDFYKASENAWKRSKTYQITGWTNAATVSAFTDFMGSGRSMYSIYQANKLSLPAGYANWAAYWSRCDAVGTTQQFNVLYITNNHGTGVNPTVNTFFTDPANATKIFGSASYSPSTNYPGGSAAAFATSVHIDWKTTADLATTDVFYENGHHKYDMIIIEPGDYNVTDGDLYPDIVEELKKLQNDKTDGLTYIMSGKITGPTIGSGSGSSTTPTPVENLTIDTNSNFGKLIDLSITTTGYAKKNNILVIGTSFMGTMVSKPDTNPTKISKIVTLINKSTYRTYAGSGSGGGSGSISTSNYRVLELQPCYPIDLQLARTITRKSDYLSKYVNVTDTNPADFNYGKYGFTTPDGNYYTVPSNVLNTSEIDNYVDTTVGSMTEEYYDWDLSKAKIAYALGMSAEQIELVQMSTDQYITAKADVADAYDLIYIGGNASALKNQYAYGAESNWGSLAPTNRQALAIFSMYSHTGELSAMSKFYGTVKFPGYNYTRVGGNDITYDRFLQMKKYIDANMPIVFSNEVWDAYLDAKGNGLDSRYMDPDSNMYKLCAYAEDKSTSTGNTSVLTDWAIKGARVGGSPMLADYRSDVATKEIDNATGIYGQAPTVRVFNDEALNIRLYNCVYGDKTSIRPKFSVDTTAIAYIEGDKNTKLTNRNVTWDVKLANEIDGHSYEAFVVEDINDNGVFDETSEKITTAVALTGGEGTVSYRYPDSEFGAFNWKLIVRDKTTGATAGTSVISCFDIKNKDKKMEASILEIMPLSASKCNSSNPSAPDGHTFYLDKNYQQSSGNPFLFSSYGTANWNKYGYEPSMQTPNKGDSDEKSSYTDAEAFNSNYAAGAYANGAFNNGGYTEVILGKYKAELSVNRYDSAAEHEDRDYNYMDLVADMYDFNLDIMYIDDIEYYANAARKSTTSQREIYRKQAATAYATYLAYETPGTPEYEALQKVEEPLREAMTKIMNGESFYSPVVTTGNGTASYLVDPSKYKTYGFEQILQSRDYFRIFYLNTDLYSYGAHRIFFEGYYKPYIQEHNKMVEAYRTYRHFNMMAYGVDEYLRQNYDVIVIGFMDDYAGDYVDFSTGAAEDLKTFTQKDDVKEWVWNATDVNWEETEETLIPGGLLMTHSNTTADFSTSWDGKSAHAVNLTNALKEIGGLCENQHLTAVSGTDSSMFAKYVGDDADRYFLSSFSTKDYFGSTGSKGTLTGAAYNNAVSQWFTKANFSTNNGKGHPFDLTDTYTFFQTSGFATSPKYLYAELEMQTNIKYNIQVGGALRVTGTTKAQQVNRGVVTTYPFYIASDLRISATHAEPYRVNLEDEDVAVWYTLAGDNVSSAGQAGGTDYALMKANSSLFAASPYDGADNYYIYSVGNVVYCGAGHALITGHKRDNNDERRLFLNVLINMAKKTKKAAEDDPEIILYDPDGVTPAPGQVVKYNTTNGYYINVNGGVSYPEFGFQFKANPGDKIESVQVFYDLDYDPASQTPEAAGTYVANEHHFLIQLPSDVITKLGSGDVVVLTKEACPGLVTKREYFDAYGGKYTYIVVRITYKDSKGKSNVITQRIKVILSSDFLDLT